MKILVVAPTPFFSDRGTHIRILEEALALEKLGHEVTIATYHIGKDITKEIETKIDVRRILRLLFWYKKLEAGPDWQKVILDLMLIRKTFFLARTKRPDIIHGHLHEGVLIGWIAQKLLFWRHIKLVADFHGSLTGEMASHGYLSWKPLRGIFNLVEKFINRLGDYAVTSSWEGTKNISSFRTDGKVETLLDGTNTDSFVLKKSKDELKEEFELPKGKLIVGYTGGLLINKGINFLLEAIPRVLEKRKDVFFFIGGFPVEEVEKYIKQNKLEAYTRVVCPLNYFTLPDFLNACDIAIDPKGTDTGQASGKMLNYMSAKLPIICFDKENNRKYLGEGGYYCQENSSDSIAEGILHFLDHPEEISQRGDFNRGEAEKFSWLKSGRQLEGIYKKIVVSSAKQENQNK